MGGQFVELTDGSRIEVKINFGTLYYLQQIGGYALARHIEKKQKQKKKVSEEAGMEFAAKIIYAVLRSNGKEVTFDEALSLMPPDTSSISQVIEAYEKELEVRKKKQEAKQKMKEFAT